MCQVELQNETIEMNLFMRALAHTARPACVGTSHIFWMLGPSLAAKSGRKGIGNHGKSCNVYIWGLS